MARSKSPPSAADLDLPKLCDSYRAARRVLMRFREERREVVRRLAGDHWSEETAEVPRPVNFLSLFCRVVPRSVIPKEPRIDLSTREPKYKATVTAMGRWVNDEIVEMNFAETIRRVFLDSLISIGITKVALAAPGDSAKAGWDLPAGYPFAERVDLDDFAYDHHARSFHEAAWFAHRCRYPLAAIKDSNLYNAAARKKAAASMDTRYNEPGDERVSMMGRQYVAGDDTEAFDYTDVVEFYLPRQKLLVTMLADQQGQVYAEDDTGPNAPLSVREWVGPDCGPYHFLCLGLVPGNAMPKGPIQDIITLDEHFNALVHKLIEQAARQKEVLAASGAADSDAQRIIDARDGESIRVDNVDKLKPMGFGGPNPNNQAFALSMWDLLNKFSGNLEAMAGLGAQASTATQEKIINANSGATVTDMQENAVAHISSVVNALCWYWHHHPQKVMKSTWSPRSMPEMSHPTPVYPARYPNAPAGARMRNFPYDDLCVKVDPYSMQHQTPGGKMAFIKSVIVELFTPLAALAQQQGVQLDMNTLFTMIGEMGDVPELSEVIKTVTPPQDEAAENEGESGFGSGGATEMSHNGPRMPVSTQRTYQRVNPSTKTEGGQRTDMIQKLLTASAARNGRTEA